MSQSKKSDPNKKNKSKTGGEQSEPALGGPSAETTEEVVSTVKQFLGIGLDDSASDQNKKAGNDPKNIAKDAAREKSSTNQPPQAPTNTNDDSNARKHPDTSKAPDTKAIQSPVNSRSARDLSSARIIAKTNSDRQSELKQPGSERPSLDPTESVVSAVTQFFGIGQDDKPSQIKKNANVRNEQIVATSQQVVDNYDGSTDARKQASGSKVSESKVPSVVIAKQKQSQEASVKGENVTSQSNVKKHPQLQDESSNEEADSQKHMSLQGLEAPSKDPTESIVSAVAQFFGISQHDKPSQTKKITDDRNEEVVTANQNVKDKQTNKNPDTVAPPTVVAKQKPSPEPSNREENYVPHTTGVQSSMRKQSQTIDSTADDGKGSRRLTETGETSSKRVTIVPGIKSTPSVSESVVPAVADSFGISNSVQNPSVIKTSYPSGETQTVHADKGETSRMINSDDTTSNKVSESKVTTSPEVIASAIPVPLTPNENKDRNKPTSNTIHPIDKRKSESKTSESKGAPTTFPSKAADSKVIPIPVANSENPQRSTESKSETPRMINDQQQPDTKLTDNTKVTPSSDIPAAPVPVVVAKQGGQDSNVRPAQPINRKESEPKPSDTKGTPATVPSKAADSKILPSPVADSNKPQSNIESKLETPRMIIDQQQPPRSSGISTPPVPVVPEEQRGQDSNVIPSSAADTKPQNIAASRIETPRLKEDSKQPATTMASDSKAPPSSAVKTSPLTDANNKSSQEEKNLPTSNIPQSVAGAQSAEPAPKDSPATVPIPATAPRALATNDSVNSAAEISSSDSRNVSSNNTSDQPQSIPSAASVKPQSVPVAAGKTETLRTLNDQKVSDSPKIDSNVPVSQAALTSNDPTGQAQPVPVSASGKQQNTVGAGKIETPRTLNDEKVADPIKNDSNVPLSTAATVTNVPPVTVNAHDASKNKGRSSIASEDRRAVEKSREGVSKVPPISTEVSQQPHPVSVDGGETQRTMEGHKPIETTTARKPETASSSPGASTFVPPPVVVNAQDRRQNNVNKAPNTNVPPAPIQSNEPVTGVATTGSSAVTGTPGPVPIRGSHTSTATARQCWICFATDEDELALPWVQPCKCKGTTKWVHQSCLQMWVDEKLREHKEKKVACPQCKTEYLIYLPKANILVRSLDQVDNFVYRVCPFIAAGVVIGSFYWNAVTYGAIVMLQVAGSEGASMVTETFSPTVIIVGLPFIPLSLIVFRLFQWEDSFLYILRTTSHSVPLLNYVLPGHVVNETGIVTDVPATTAMSFQRVLAGALLTPIIAKMFGNLFFPTVTSPVWRTVLGGALFVSAKGLIKMYHKQQTYKRLSRRKILDYTDENKKMIEQSRPLMMNQVAPPPLRFQFVATVENGRSRRR